MATVSTRFHGYEVKLTVQPFSFHGSTALVGKGLLILEASRSHSDTPHAVGLL